MGAFDNGNIVKEVLTRELISSIGGTQPSFIPVINSAVDFCFSYVNKKNKKPSAEAVEKQQQGGKKCNNISFIMLVCTKLQMIKVSLNFEYRI